MATPVILVVDANEGTRNVIADLLICGGLRAVGVADGTAALEVTARVRPSLVLLDCVPPTLDGLATLALLRAMPATRDVPVVVYSGGATDAVRERAARLGAAECIDKNGHAWPRLLERVGFHLAKPGGPGFGGRCGDDFWTR